MAGGTSRKDHSEVGSSYIHFNFTPDGDKTTPSLIGDVPRGEMLNQTPIFLGRQGVLWLDKIVEDICPQAAAIVPSLHLFRNLQNGKRL